MKTAKTLLAATGAFLILITSAVADTAPFSISIVPENCSEAGAGISWGDGSKRVFYVVFTNLTDSAQPVFRNANSWGYQNLSFTMTLRSGDVTQVSVRGQNFTVNFPGTFLISPGGHRVISVTLNEAWEGKPDWGRGRTEVVLKAVYEVAETEESIEKGVWTGRIESAPLAVEVNHW